MAEESTLLIVKPDAVRRGLIGEILSRIERKGLRIEALRMMRVDRDLAERHYGEHAGKPFFGELVEFITSGDVVVAKVTGPQAVEVLRTLMGATDPVKSAPGTIRGDYGTVITENLVHGSDSPESAKRELDLFFAGEAAEPGVSRAAG
jgi:nucleoside-diphosphate kinase